MTGIANLGMYDGGDLSAANDALWSAVARRLEGFGMPDVPTRLERTRELAELWASDQLVLGQICGYPFAARYRGQLRLIGAPRYSAPGCVDDQHRSFVIVHERAGGTSLEALRGAHAVINEDDSMTGRHLLGDAIEGIGGGAGFFARVTVSGSHAASLERVATRAADVAAIDCVSYAHLLRAEPALVAATRIVHRTRATPTLPFVIASEHGADAAELVSHALRTALEDPATAAARHTLMLVGMSRLEPSAYDRTVEIAANADCVFGAERCEMTMRPGNAART